MSAHAHINVRQIGNWIRATCAHIRRLLHHCANTSAACRRARWIPVHGVRRRRRLCAVVIEYNCCEKLLNACVLPPFDTSGIAGGCWMFVRSRVCVCVCMVYNKVVFGVKLLCIASSKQACLSDWQHAVRALCRRRVVYLCWANGHTYRFWGSTRAVCISEQ